MKAEVVLITGASSGIGLELAKLFAADKSQLVLVARRQDRLEQLAEQLRSEHDVKVCVMAEDLASVTGPQRIAERLLENKLEVDVLVNNAGFGLVGPLSDLPHQQQLEMVQLNVVTLTDLTRRLLPGMLQRDRGAILNVASTAAFQPGVNMAVYFATKAYVLSLTEALAEETRTANVSVTCLCPGPTATEFDVRSHVDETLLFRLGTMKAKTVAQRGYRAMRNGKVIKIPGPINGLLTFWLRFTPRWVVRRITAALLVRRWT